MVEKIPPMKVELTIKAEGLIGYEDPLCRVLFYDPKTLRFNECFKTTPCRERVNPQWEAKIELNYYFDSKQDLRFSIEDTSDHTIGIFDTTLGQIVSQNEAIGNLEGDSRNGIIKISAKELKNAHEKVSIRLRAHNVDKMDLFGKSDPYFIFYKQGKSEPWTQIYKSETIKNTLDPQWKPFELTFTTLCNNNPSLPLKIECWDYDWSSKDDFIGACEINFHQLSVPNVRFQLIHPSKQKKNPKKYQNSGVIEIENLHVRQTHTFLDYIQAGTELNLIFAIDFTISNTDYRNKSSLHYIDPNAQNEYERTISCIGNILADYDKEKIYPVFGFGGEPEWSRKVDHCFPINKNNINPDIVGINNVLQAYRQILPCIKLAGPTILGSIISKSLNITRNSPTGGVYYLLVIMVDGEVQDVNQTKIELVESSFSPMSVVIVGVGLESFSSMQEFTSFPIVDENGRKSCRNNVIFYTYKSFGGNAGILTSSILSKIPQHLLEYMEMISCEPIVLEEHKTIN
ncbi:hypothetical protein SteCoe_9773 [Stentor coeruleus]|uniref:C2 domain-containing protein n=1 Tax=Stentor coeruleus TaxID=5963 RepID=A0A1R2CH74_9CILI|nr:hypothetical protein SteCoe_9773 [Stentor coeruleus]